MPNIPHLRALYLPNVDKQAHVDPKELALQILDIVTLRPEIELCYIGIQKKCYEILEDRIPGKKNAFNDMVDSQDELLPASGDQNDPEADDDEDEDGNDVNSNDDDSDIFNNTGDNYSDEDDVSLDCGKPKVEFRLREILFYDDKISIFKARHGEL